jgi:hypothetical protein
MRPHHPIMKRLNQTVERFRGFRSNSVRVPAAHPSRTEDREKRV